MDLLYDVDTMLFKWDSTIFLCVRNSFTLTLEAALREDMERAGDGESFREDRRTATVVGGGRRRYSVATWDTSAAVPTAVALIVGSGGFVPDSYCLKLPSKIGINRLMLSFPT